MSQDLLSGQSCYIICNLQGATAVGLDQELDQQAVRGPEHTALDVQLRALCVARRNPVQPPLSPLPLLQALNPCLVLSGQYQFNNVVGWDAAEFLSSLLGELAILPGFLVETLEEGVCQVCGNPSQQVCSIILQSVTVS